MPAPVLGPSDSAGSSHPHSGTRTPRFTRLVVALGLASTLVASGGVVPAMLLAPWFSPFEHAPSYPGIAGLGTAPLFNGSLLVGGARGAGFVVAVRAVTEHPARRAALVVLLPAMVCVALIGAFPLPAALHEPVAVGFFAFVTIGLFLWSASDYAAGRSGRGAAIVAAAVVHAVSWA